MTAGAESESESDWLYCTTTQSTNSRTTTTTQRLATRAQTRPFVQPNRGVPGPRTRTATTGPLQCIGNPKNAAQQTEVETRRAWKRGWQQHSPPCLEPVMMSRYSKSACVATSQGGGGPSAEKSGSSAAPPPRAATTHRAQVLRDVPLLVENGEVEDDGGGARSGDEAPVLGQRADGGPDGAAPASPQLRLALGGGARRADRGGHELLTRHWCDHAAGGGGGRRGRGRGRGRGGGGRPPSRERAVHEGKGVLVRRRGRGGCHSVGAASQSRHASRTLRRGAPPRRCRRPPRVRIVAERAVVIAAGRPAVAR